MSDEINFPVYSGVILNISYDHLDWHKNFQDYIMAKINIFNQAKNKIANFDCKEQIKKYISCDEVDYFGASENKEGFYGQKKNDLIQIFQDGKLIYSKKKNITNLDNAIASVSVLNNHLEISKNIITILLNFVSLEHRFENFLIKMESNLLMIQNQPILVPLLRH